MKKLQSNFTTPEQSRRLLELGVPAGSADCYLMRQGNEDIYYPFIIQPFFDHIAVIRDSIPCWSVGRLIEILMICGNYFAPKEFKIEQNSMKPSLIKNIVDKIEELKGYDVLDFSKLED